MRKVPLTCSLLYFLDEIEFTEAGLSADPDAKALAPDFQAALDEWEPLFKKERLARREVTRAEAVVAVRNEQLDFSTGQFVALVRAVASNLLSRFFKDEAPGRFVRRGLREQSQKTRDVIVPVLTKLEASHPLKPFEPTLDSGAKGALSALDHRSKVKGANQVTANEVLEWKEGINTLRVTTYAELLKIAAEKNYPKSWVESFFRQSSTSSEPTTEQDPSTPTIPTPTE